MRNLFRGHYKPSEEEFKELWQDAVFSFDANILLNIYRYSSATREDFFKIVDALKDRVFIPYQAAKEFQKERLNVISHQSKPYDEIQNLLNNNFEDLKKKLDEYRKRHSFTDFVDIDKNRKIIERAHEKVKGDLEKSKRECPDLVSDDRFRDRLTEILEGRVGKPYSEERLEDLYKEAKMRYENKIPPGYEDSPKGVPDKYSDFIIWFQLIEHAKSQGKPLIFVTDDNKEDWWLKHKGKTIGPRPELIEEMLESAGVLLYLYNGSRFIDYASTFLELSVQPEVIEEANEVGLFEEDSESTVEEGKGEVLTENQGTQSSGMTSNKFNPFVNMGNLSAMRDAIESANSLDRLGNLSAVQDALKAINSLDYLEELRKLSRDNHRLESSKENIANADVLDQ